MLTGNMGEGFTEFTALFVKLCKNKIYQDNASPWWVVTGRSIRWVSE